MCLGIPMRIVRVWNEGELRLAEAEAGGVKTEIDVSLLEDVEVGDYVIVHAGIAISKLDESEAKELIKLFNEIASELS
ncbi:MAG: HypC/HybG/HupF family hydrogenase formation chaperone [Desulfurococcales archaeon]|nr:HypC/HybG/HupF family hydrogenase formation chaperone [Desulfurococcales archaeon]